MRRKDWLVVSIITALAASLACTSAEGASRQASAVAIDSARADSITRARQDSINRAQPGYVIDSVLPVDEELRRFRAAIGGPELTALQHASPSRETLVRRVIAAVSAADTAELRAMALSVREFADLVFPSSPFAHAPYRQPIGLAWQQIEVGIAEARTKLVRRLGGKPLRYVDHDCSGRPDHQGRNIIWSACAARVIASGGDTLRLRLFGSIIEREGRYKVGSFR